MFRTGLARSISRHLPTEFCPVWISQIKFSYQVSKMFAQGALFCHSPGSTCSLPHFGKEGHSFQSRAQVAQKKSLCHPLTPALGDQIVPVCLGLSSCKSCVFPLTQNTLVVGDRPWPDLLSSSPPFGTKLCQADPAATGGLLLKGAVPRDSPRRGDGLGGSGRVFPRSPLFLPLGDESDPAQCFVLTRKTSVPV